MNFKLPNFLSVILILAGGALLVTNLIGVSAVSWWIVFGLLLFPLAFWLVMVGVILSVGALVFIVAFIAAMIKGNR